MIMAVFYAYSTAAASVAIAAFRKCTLCGARTEKEDSRRPARLVCVPFAVIVVHFILSFFTKVAHTRTRITLRRMRIYLRDSHLGASTHTHRDDGTGARIVLASASFPFAMSTVIYVPRIACMRAQDMCVACRDLGAIASPLSSSSSVRRRDSLCVRTNCAASAHNTPPFVACQSEHLIQHTHTHTNSLKSNAASVSLTKRKMVRERVRASQSTCVLYVWHILHYSMCAHTQTHTPALDTHRRRNSSRLCTHHSDRSTQCTACTMHFIGRLKSRVCFVRACAKPQCCCCCCCF